MVFLVFSLTTYLLLLSLPALQKFWHLFFTLLIVLFYEHLPFLFFFLRKGLCNPGCPGTCCIGQAGLELRLDCLCYQVMGLKVWPPCLAWASLSSVRKLTSETYGTLSAFAAPSVAMTKHRDRSCVRETGEAGGDCHRYTVHDVWKAWWPTMAGTSGSQANTVGSEWQNSSLFLWLGLRPQLVGSCCPQRKWVWLP